MNQAPLLPGSTIGIVGGGQLGRMLAFSAHRHGYRVAVLSGGAKDTPAGRVAEVEIVAPFDDEMAIERLIAESDVITWEFENVDAGFSDHAEAAGVPVRPSGAIIATAQDRIAEKHALEAAGVRVAPWRSARSVTELRSAIEHLGFPVIAKAARFGYDGKGQVRIDHAAQIDAAWERLGAEPRGKVVVESVVAFERELSAIVARGIDGELANHGVMQNHHVDHILDTTMVPASIDSTRATAAVGLAGEIASAWNLVGVLCVELFDTGAELVVNEIAPRPHNSGHCTIEAAASSQFDQQLRAICGLPLGDGSCRPAAMVQLLGDLWRDGEPNWGAALADPGIRLHLYGKTEPRIGRKMGHLTCVANRADHALQRASDARAALMGQ